MATKPLTKAQRAALGYLTEDRNRCLFNPWRKEGWCRFPVNVHGATLNGLRARGMIEQQLELVRLTEAGRAALKEASE